MSTLRVLDKDGNWVDIPTIVGPVGPVGPTGETGPGVSSGGSAGQILRKKSGDDFDTEWVTPTDMDLYYTKEEADDLINSKISTTFKYKGTKSSYAAIQAVTNPSVGDVWNDSSTDHNYVWNGSTWDKLAGTVDMSNYYTMDEAEDMVDNKLAAVPINNLLHYKGHVDTIEDLPKTGQPSAELVEPSYSLSTTGSNCSTSYLSRVTALVTTSEPYYFGFTSSGTNANNAQFVIRTAYPQVFDYINKIGSVHYIHLNASSTTPARILTQNAYGSSRAYTINFDDGTTYYNSSGSTYTITKPCWVRVEGYTSAMNSYAYGNLPHRLKIKNLPTTWTSNTSTSSPSQYTTWMNSSTGYNYAEGYDVIKFNSNNTYSFVGSEPAEGAALNNVYTVGSMRELYRCNEKPEWEKWSDFKEFQVTEMTEEDYSELSDKNTFDMYILDRMAEVTETTNLLLNSITGDIDLVEANISEEEALAITNEIIGGVSNE